MSQYSRVRGTRYLNVPQGGVYFIQLPGIDLPARDQERMIVFGRRHILVPRDKVIWFTPFHVPQ